MAASEDDKPAEVRRLGRHPQESLARRMEDYLDRGALHLPPGMELDREYRREMGSDASGDGAAAAAHMLGSVGGSLWGKIAETYETVTGQPQPDPNVLRDELLADSPSESPADESPAD
jgi:hypothetical protein